MSTTEVEILGDGRFAGAAANITDFGVTEYGSPLSLSDLMGGVTDVQFGVLEDDGFDGSILLPGQPFVLRDPRAGSQEGVVDGVSSSDGVTLNVRGNGKLLRLVSHRDVPAFSGTLGQALTYYFSLCGIESGFQFDPDISIIPVNLPRWQGEVWTQIKKLMAIHQFEVAEVAGRIVIRKLRLREVDVQRYTSARLEYGRTNASQVVEVHYYNNEWVVDRRVYPDPAVDLAERPIISVDASETVVQNYPVNMWISEIDPPIHVATMPPDETATNSGYSVVDNDGRMVTPAQWANGGGMVSFAIGADGKSIDVTVRGSSTQDRAPYRIAASSQDREYQYAALNILATGVAFDEKVVWSATGVDLRDAPADAVTVIDDPMVSTREEAVTVLANAVRLESGFQQTLDVSATAVNRRGETGEQLYPTFGEFDEAYGSLTFGQFDNELDGATFAEWTATQGATTVEDFSNQALGAVGGARVRHRDNIYRITTATTAPDNFQWTAAPDLLFSEWDELSEDAPRTFGEFDAKWTGKTFEQHARMPLA